MLSCLVFFFFFFNDTATTEIYTLSLHDALPISPTRAQPGSLPNGMPSVPSQRFVRSGCASVFSWPSELESEVSEAKTQPLAPANAGALVRTIGTASTAPIDATAITARGRLRTALHHRRMTSDVDPRNAPIAFPLPRTTLRRHSGRHKGSRRPARRLSGGRRNRR